ncbi:hypothetical protein ABE039_24725 [Priestia megaterium]
MSDKKEVKYPKENLTKEELRKQVKDSYKKLVERNGPALKRLSES